MGRASGMARARARVRPAINADSRCDFAIGSQMTVLGISDAAFQPDFHGVLVDVQ